MEAVVALVSGANRVDIARLAAVVGLPNPAPRQRRGGRRRDRLRIGGIPPFAHRRARCAS